MGHPQLATDTSRVRRWIDTGEIPRDPVPRVLAALFTERLGRVVTIEDLGLVRHGRAGKRQGGGSVEHPDGVPWAPERTAAVLTEFTGMDLMLNRRGLVGAGAALAAGSALSSAMHDWLHTDPALAADAPDLDNPLHADPAGFDRYEAAPIGSQEIEELERSVEVFRAWDAARGGGLQRKAVVGQLNEVGGMLSYRHPDHLQRRLWGVAANLAVLAGWMSHDVGLEPTAQKYFVIAAHAAREGGDRPRAGRGALPGGPSDGAPGPARRRARPHEARQVRIRRRDPAAHPGHALHHRGLGTGVDGQGPGHAAHPRRGGGPLRLRQGRRAAAELDADVRRGGPARDAGPGLPHPRRARPVRGDHRAAPRQGGAGAAGERAGSGRRSSTTSRWRPPASSPTTPNRPTGTRAWRWCRWGRTPPTAPGTGCARCTGSPAQYSSYPKIDDLREEIKLALPKGSLKAEGRQAARGRERPVTAILRRRP